MARAFIQSNDGGVKVSFKRTMWLPLLSPRDLTFLGLIAGGLFGVGVVFLLLSI